ncbi:MAG: hypothetical protein V3V41_07160, partial [Candidatus Heimdallarchaeota archaeon]
KQRAIILLTIHLLETRNYTEALFYMEQLSFDEINEFHPQLAHKLGEVSKSLEKSQKMGKIHTNLKFSRSDLELPVEHLLQEEEIFEGFPELDKPSSLELQELNANLATFSSVDQLKSPSIESLQELFESEIEAVSPPESIGEDITPEVDISQMISIDETTQSDVDSEQVRDVIIDQVFSSHLERSIVSSTLMNQDQTEFIPPASQEDSSLEEDIQPEIRLNIRSEVGQRLQRAGWSVQLNFSSSTRQDAEPDIVAERGLIRKRKKLIFFAENVPDAEICSFLLQSNPELGEKIVFLLEGNPQEANVSIRVKIINRIDQLF